MRVVIDITEDIYNDIKKGFACSEYGDELIKSVEKGTPIPKGCGRLVDADVLDNGLREQQKSYEHTFGARQLINEAVRDGIIIARTYIEYAPIIIEAERGEK